jgi:NADPH2:quinone reductase
MRAIAMTGFDAAPTLTDLDVPEPKEGEVRVRIRAASVNGFDLAVAAGYTKDYMEHRFPLVLGKDFAGEVDALGAGVTGYAVGDRVFGTVTKPYLGDGSFAEYVTIPTAVGLAPLPESISFTDAAALGLAGAAAYGIIDEATLEPGHIVLVVGATGGVGNQVVQLAAAAGAQVIATAHTDAERELVTRLGAQATVDHTGDLTSQVRAIAPDGVNVLAHLAGDPGVVELVGDRGRFISTLIQSPDQVPSQTATVIPIYANPTREVLDRVSHGLASGEATVTVQQIFPLDQAQAAFDTFAQGTLGKVVITTD